MSEYTFAPEHQLYLGRENAVTVVPYSDYAERTNFDMLDVTRITCDADLNTDTNLIIPGDAIQAASDDVPALVSKDVTTGVWLIHAKVGLFTGITAAIYSLRFTLYSPTYPNGFVLPDGGSLLLVDIKPLP
jgi:hypothetical protein